MNQYDDMYVIWEWASEEKSANGLVEFTQIDWRCQSPVRRLPFPRSAPPKDTHPEIDQLLHVESRQTTAFIYVDIVTDEFWHSRISASWRENG